MLTEADIAKIAVECFGIGQNCKKDLDEMTRRKIQNFLQKTLGNHKNLSPDHLQNLIRIVKERLYKRFLPESSCMLLKLVKETDFLLAIKWQKGVKKFLKENFEYYELPGKMKGLKIIAFDTNEDANFFRILNSTVKIAKELDLGTQTLPYRTMVEQFLSR